MTAAAGHYQDYHEQVGMGEAVRRFFGNYANFTGRSNRGEFWWMMLASLIISIVLTVLDIALLGSEPGSYGILTSIWGLATLIPGLALAVRRLHDIDKSGWWLLIALIPIVGAIILIVWYATRGQAGANRFG